MGRSGGSGAFVAMADAQTELLERVPSDVEVDVGVDAVRNPYILCLSRMCLVLASHMNRIRRNPELSQASATLRMKSTDSGETETRE